MIQLSTWNILHKDLVPLILTYGHNQHLLYQAGKNENSCPSKENCIIFYF